MNSITFIDGQPIGQSTTMSYIGNLCSGIYFPYLEVRREEKQKTHCYYCGKLLDFTERPCGICADCLIKN